MRFFYLELNAFIVSGKKILNINKEKGFVFTSSWSLVEQFININENNYGLIKSNLKLIKESKILIDKDDIFKKVYDAFMVKIPLYENNNDYLIKIMNTIIDSKNFNNIDTNTLNDIMKLKEIKNISIINNSKMYNDFLKNSRNIINNVFDENFWYRMVFELLVMTVKRGTNLSIEQIKEQYNGSLNRYIYASAQFFGKNHKNDKNDFIDLEHYKYISNDIIHMVSDDKIMKFYDKKRVYTVNEFLEYMK